MLKAMIFAGLISLITGLIMVLWPGKTLYFVAILIGVWLLLIGLIRFVEAFTRKDLARNRRLLVGVSGLLYVIIGAICLRDMFTSLGILTVIIGLVWTVGGAAEIASGWPKVLPVALGLASLAVGIAVFLWPAPTLTIITTVIGLWFIAIGLIQVPLAYAAYRRARPNVHSAA